MTTITSEDELIDYILRKLGYPVIDINISPEQIRDRISDSLQLFFDYHYNGSTRVWLHHQLTAEDIANKYITTPEYITGITEVVNPYAGLSSSNIYNYQYIFTQSEMFSLGSTSILDYNANMTRLNLLDDLLNGLSRIRYEKHNDKVYIDTDWSKFSVGQYLVFDCYRTLNPDEFSDVWNDRWLKKHATALCKLQWGENMGKFINVSLMNGVQMNAERIINDAKEEIAKIEEDLQISGVGVPMGFVG
jgi:hypothetical protein